MSEQPPLASPGDVAAVGTPGASRAETVRAGAEADADRRDRADDRGAEPGAAEPDDPTAEHT